MNKYFKSFLLCTMLIAVSFEFLDAGRPSWRPFKQKSLAKADKVAVSNQFTLSGNNWAFEMTNDGPYAQDVAGRLPDAGGAGGEFPRGTGTYIIYAAGLQIGALVDKDGVPTPKVSVVDFDSEFQPGPLTKSDPYSKTEVPVASNPGLETNKLFALYKDGSDGTPFGTNGDATDDYAKWPAADGAPTKADGSPLIIGDLMSWCVYNDMDPALHVLPDDSQPDPLGLEVQQASIQVNITGYSDVFFMYWKIINKGTTDLTNVYTAGWFDADVDKSGNDLVATDTSASMVFMYNSDNTDPVSAGGSAFGADFFQGPVVTSENDTARYLELTQDGFVQREVPGKKVLGLSATVRYINVRGSEGDPDNDEELYNLMQGKEKNGDARQGGKFTFPSDPLTAPSSELDPRPDDKRMMLCTGPFDLAVGDTQVVVLACVGGKGTDRLDAIRNLRLTDQIAQKAYDAKFLLPQPPPSPKLTATALSNKVVLQWDNGSEFTDDRYPQLANLDIPNYEARDFAGYKVYRSASGTVGSWTKIAQFDKHDGVTVIPETTWVVQDQSIKSIREITIGDDKGLAYTYTDNDVVNGQVYYYAVTAYDAQPNIRSGAAPITLEGSQSANAVRVTPQPPTIGNQITATAQDTAVHVGPGDGMVLVSVVDPKAVTGHDYRVEIEDVQVTDLPSQTTSTERMWKLFDVTKNAYVKFFRADDPNTDIDESYYQTNQAKSADPSTAEAFVNVDGLKIRLLGPPPGMKDWDVSGTRQWTWVGGNWGSEGFSGAIGNGYDQWFSGSSVTYEQLKNVEIRFAATDTAGNILDPNDPNASFGYRYLRSAAAAPAQPSFAPFIVNPGAGYAFQEYAKSMPLAAYDMEANPPRRLMVGYLENNQPNGLVDGKYWPPYNADPVYGDNIGGTGPREWLFIFDVDYSETADASLSTDILNNTLPVMWFATITRRDQNGYSPTWTFSILSNHINTPADVFTFSTTANAPFNAALAKSKLNKNYIKVVPNPYYGFSAYDQNQFNRRVKFTGLPDQCIIRIFNVAGDLVRTINHNASSNNERSSSAAEYTSVEYWDLTSDNGIFISSGVYFMYIDAPGIGKSEELIPFAIIQGSVQLTVPTN